MERELYGHSDDISSNWVRSHVAAACAALFEQCYVSTFNRNMPIQEFFEYMKSNDVGEDDALINYANYCLKEKTFMDLRYESVFKMIETYTAVRHYGVMFKQYPSYPAEEVAEYLRNLAEQMKASADFSKTTVNRYKTLNVWKLDSSSKVQVKIDNENTVNFRDWQKALLDMDVLNNKNYADTYDYQAAAIYDLIVRSGLMVITLSPNLAIGALGASMTSQWDSLSAYAFDKLDSAWSQKAMLAAIKLGSLSMKMGSLLTTESEIATDLRDLMFALNDATIVDPPLSLELVSLAVEDVVLDPSTLSGTGKAHVILRNDGDKAIIVAPQVSIYDRHGYVGDVDFGVDSMTIQPGESVQFDGTFAVRRSTIEDATGYSAVLTYAASEPATVSVASEQGPFITHFYAGSQSAIAAMRQTNSAGTLASGWLEGAQTLTGTIEAAAGDSIRIFAAAAVNQGLKIVVTDPDGQVLTGDYFINDGDYFVIDSARAGTYTVTVTTPDGFDGRVTIESVKSRFSKAVVDAHVSPASSVRTYMRTVEGEDNPVPTHTGYAAFAIAETAGMDAGSFTATMEFEDAAAGFTAALDFSDMVVIGTDGKPVEMTADQALTLAAGSAFSGGFTVTVPKNTSAGTYHAWISISFDASTVDPALLSKGVDAGYWTIANGTCTYRAPVSIVVDLVMPSEPTLAVTDIPGSTGMVQASGTAAGAEYVVLVYEKEMTTYKDKNGEDQLYLDENGDPYTYTDQIYAGITVPDSNGAYSLVVAKPTATGYKLRALAIGSTGTTFSVASVEDIAPAVIQPDAPETSYASSFSSVNASQVNVSGKATNIQQVAVQGAALSGNSVQGAIWYRVVNAKPDHTSDLATDVNFDTGDWACVGANTMFDVPGVIKGQFIEVVQLVEVTIYGTIVEIKSDGTIVVEMASGAKIEPPVGSEGSIGDIVAVSSISSPVRRGYVAANTELENVLVEIIRINKSTTTVRADEEEQLIALLTPEYATHPEVSWTSSNPAVAKVGSNGVVTGVSTGTAIITATTTDGSNLSASCTVTVPKSLGESGITVGELIFTGGAQTPTVTVKDGDASLTEGTDYTIAYCDAQGNPIASPEFVNAGTYYVKVTGAGEYVGSEVIKEFTIDPKTLVEENIDKIANQAYTGLALTPAVTVRVGSDTLGQDTDYTVAYANNVNAGVDTATVTITGKGNYTGSLSITFTIDPKSFSGSTTLSTIEDQVFTGSAANTALTVMDGETGLVKGTDYEVSFTKGGEAVADPIEVGEYTVTVTGKGNYTGSKTTTFSITAKAISSTDIIVATIAQATFAGAAVTPEPAVTFGNAVLVKGTDYTIAYLDAEKNALAGDPVNVGTYYARITGQGNYGSYRDVEFAIAPKAFSDNMTFSVVEGQAYTGNPADLTVTVVDGSATLVQGTDYTVVFTKDGETVAAPTDAGTYTATITGMGNYASTSTKTVTLTIVPKDFSTTASIAEFTTPTYSGSAIDPVAIVIVTDGAKTLVQGTDYTAVFAPVPGDENAKLDANGIPLTAGNYNVKIEGVGNYQGAKTADSVLTIAPKNLGAGNIAAIAGQTYTGQELKPEPVVTDGAKPLVKGTDYTVDYNANINAGTATVIIHGQGNYSGDLEVNFTIAQATNSWTTTPAIANWEAGQTPSTPVGAAQFSTANEPHFSYYEDADKSVVFVPSPSTAPGTYYMLATVNGTTNYTGLEELVTFIVTRSIADATATLSETSFTYNGDPETSRPVITALTLEPGAVSLDEGTDYTVSYRDSNGLVVDNPKDAGTYKLVITGTGRYSNTVIKEFTISPANLTGMVLQPSSYTYDGTAKNPTVLVYGVNDTLLAVNTDYTLSTPDDRTNVGTYTYTAIGTGNYTGTVEATFTIVVARVSVSPRGGLVYNGALQAGVEDGTGYRLSGITSATNAGSYTATATLANANYVWSDGSTGPKSISWSIAQRDVSDVTVTVSSVTYTGSELRPEVVVTWNGRMLVKDVDYTVTYSNNVNVGNGKVTVVGAGTNYKGSKTVDFVIEPNGIDMYRLYNPNSGEHFYTADVEEKNYLASIGWNYEGVGWTAPSKSNTPVYRLYNSYGGEHHYTIDADERDALVAAGWNYEGIGWYSDDAKSVPLYREYNPNAFANNHNYTTDASEHAWLLSIGWRGEGIGWYGLA